MSLARGLAGGGVPAAGGGGEMIDDPEGVIAGIMLRAPVRAVAYRPDGRLLASASEDGTVRPVGTGTMAPHSVRRSSGIRAATAVRIAWAPQSDLFSLSNRHCPHLRGVTPGWVPMLPWCPVAHHSVARSAALVSRIALGHRGNHTHCWRGILGPSVALSCTRSHALRTLPESPFPWSSGGAIEVRVFPHRFPLFPGRIPRAHWKSLHHASENVEHRAS